MGIERLLQLNPYSPQPPTNASPFLLKRLKSLKRDLKGLKRVGPSQLINFTTKSLK
jgi:hypothetical protein